VWHRTTETTKNIPRFQASKCYRLQCSKITSQPVLRIFNP